MLDVAEMDLIEPHSRSFGRSCELDANDSGSLTGLEPLPVSPAAAHATRRAVVGLREQFRTVEIVVTERLSLR